MLSFGEEAEEDEVETNHYVQKNSSKIKSVHDVGDDPTLSKQTLAIQKDDGEDGGGGGGNRQEENKNASADEEARKEKTDLIRSKLKNASKNRTDHKGEASDAKKTDKSEAKKVDHKSDSDEDVYGGLERERKEKRKKEA